MTAVADIIKAANLWTETNPVPEVIALIELAREQADQVVVLSRKVSEFGGGTANPNTVKVRNQIARRRLRDQMTAAGCTPEKITHALEKLRFDQLVAIHGKEGAARILYKEAKPQPDDRRYRPTSPPAELRGAGRATGETAAAVRAGKTITKWQHDERTGE